jgi:hypothetical protein
MAIKPWISLRLPMKERYVTALCAVTLGHTLLEQTMAAPAALRLLQ